MLVAGIMSGTSLNGIDVAIVKLSGQGWRLKLQPVAFATSAYPKAVRAALLGVSNTNCHTADIARLHALLPELYAEAVTGLCAREGIDRVDLVGCHGQTIFHQGAPAKYLGRRIATTLQIGDGCRLAERLGVPVISDFRSRDVAAGGHGAPLAPYFDYLVFRHTRRGRVALNLGGIGNLTAIPPGAPPEDVLAFDTGPANMVIDQLVARHTNGRLLYDADAKLGRRGHAHLDLVDQLLRDRYFRQAPPKTAGREEYGAEFVERLLATGLPMLDLIATATAFTAATVASQIDRFVRPIMAIDDLIVGGGGARNPLLMAYLDGFLPGTAITTTAGYGFDAEAKEAIFFAVLAYERWHGRTNNLPSATGARHAAGMGKVSL
ncbi:MAG: anhydro-N-acetylmuramic acid kinase [Bryobacteraceae bacterium]|nr:anhydro-N-acetylmuramic acid kinase [Bryobacteraceae bacterium]